MERLDVEASALARLRQGQAYADARARCLTCGTSGPASGESPEFCPNLRLFAERRNGEAIAETFKRMTANKEFVAK